MTDSAPRLVDLLRDQAAAGSLAATDLERIDSEASAVLGRRGAPWYLQLFLFLGALVAAAMFSVAIALLIGLRGPEPVAAFSIAAGYLVAAVLLHRRGPNVYTDALALALSIGGHAFAMIGVVQDGGEFPACFLVALVLCAILYRLYRDPLHRFAGCLLVLVLAKGALVQAELGGLTHVAVALTTAAAAILLTRERELPEWRPLAYACCAGLLVMLLPVGDRQGGDLEFLDHAMPMPWIAALLQGLALLWILHWSSQRAGGQPVTTVQRVLAVAIAAALASLSAPGIVAALFLAVLGHASHHGLITALALLSLPGFLWKYYHNLELDFLEKSAVLALSGVLLLIARAVLDRRRRPVTAGQEVGP